MEKNSILGDVLKDMIKNPKKKKKPEEKEGMPLIIQISLVGKKKDK